MNAIISTYQGDQFDWTGILPTGDWSGMTVKCDMVHRKTGARYEFSPIVTIGATTSIQLLEQSAVTAEWETGDWDADIRIRRSAASYGPFTSGKFVIQVQKPITANFP